MAESSFISVKAAADYLGNGAIEINRYESEILDKVRRTSPTIQRFNPKPATGHPHRYFEQTGIATASFTDPRNITPTATGATRVERTAFIKAITAQSNFSMFDVDVTRQQGQFAATEAKDIDDIISSVVVTQASGIWTGNDTSLSAPTTFQYMGALSQIGTQSTVLPGASIIDSLKAEVAQLVSNIQFTVRPSAIYIAPVLGDYIDREAKAQQLTLDKVELTAGVSVRAIMTQAGPLPLIPDPYLQPFTTASYGFAAPTAPNKVYPAVIVSEDMMEMPYVAGEDQNPNPRLFQLGLLAGLQGQYIGIKFDALIVKGANYAHATVGVVRP